MDHSTATMGLLCPRTRASLWLPPLIVTTTNVATAIVLTTVAAGLGMITIVVEEMDTIAVGTMTMIDAYTVIMIEGTTVVDSEVTKMDQVILVPKREPLTIC